MNDFTPRIQSTVYPSRRRAVMWQGRLMRPANEVEVVLFGRPVESTQQRSGQQMKGIK